MLNRSAIFVFLMFAFAINTASAAPIAPSLITPLGSQASSSPEFRWTQVEDATWYRVWSDTPRAGLLPKWVRAEDACNVVGVGICHYSPAVTFIGTVTWQVRVNDALGGPCGQHDVTRLPSGNILFFDNGIYCPPGYPDRGESSRAVEYEIDEVNKVATLVWSYSQDTYSTVAGSARRMPNGNTIIGWGGRTTGASGTEVDADGKVVWEFDLLRDDTVRGSYRILRYTD